MTDDLDRRQLLRTSLGIAVAGGLTAAGLARAAPAAATTRGGPDYPDVPGMLGDREANEFWYQFDEVAGYNPSQEVIDAYRSIGAYIGGNLFGRFPALWLQHVAQPDYPRNFAAFVAPIAAELSVLSRAQLGAIDLFYRRHDPGLIDAFAWFGQGVLFDPRRAEAGAPVHTMDGNPPQAYHVWWVCLRAMTLAGVDVARWRELGPKVAFAWAVQSVAKPDILTVNPPLPPRDVRRLRASWLPRSLRQLDIDFQSAPYPAGIA